MQFYSLILSLTTYHLTLHSVYLLVTHLFIRVSSQLDEMNTSLQAFRCIELMVHIVISVIPDNHLHLSQVKQVRVKCFTQGHSIETMFQH